MNGISVENMKAGSVKLLKSIPTIDCTLNIGGKKITYKNAPLVEALVSAVEDGADARRLLDVSVKQIKQVLKVEKDQLVANSAFEEKMEESAAVEEISFSVAADEPVSLAESSDDVASDDDWQEMSKASDINLSEKVSNLSQEAKDLF